MRSCRAELNDQTSVNGPLVQPRVGDLSVCVYCCTVIEFDQALQLRALTQDEIDALDPEERRLLEHAVSVVKLAHEHGLAGVFDAAKGEH